MLTRHLGERSIILLVGRPGPSLHVSLHSFLALSGIPTISFAVAHHFVLVLVGWSFQGGLSGDTGGSRFGLGVDHIVQIEMVLPNGYHVKFGPTEWEDASAEGFIVPKTIGVTGLCRSNPDEQDEEEWIWGTCPDDFDVDFMDLWYAVRGGGGGTWGVVLSMHLQLHDPVPRVDYHPSTSEECLAVFKDPPILGAAYHPIWVEFYATYAMTPSVLNVTEEQSRACGSPMPGQVPLCYGEENVRQAWTTFVEMKNITGGADCVVRSEGDGLPSVSAPGTRFEGQIMDNPSPGLGPLIQTTGLLIPKAWVEKVGVESVMEKFGTVELAGTKMFTFAQNYYAFGSAAVADDQANSLSQAHRDAGVMVGNVNRDETFWRDIAPEIYDLDDPTNFPPMFGSNHAANGLTGPLKDDWTKPCPSDWTFAERLAGCVSFQEAIYGTKTLRRLEAIKKVVDPNNMFRCDNCVGSNLEVEKNEAVPAPNVGNEGGNVVEPPTPNQEGDVAEKDDSAAIKEDDVGSSSWYPRKSVVGIAIMIGTAVNIFIN